MNIRQLDAGIRVALQEAQKAYSEGEIPVGCALLDAEGSLISSTHNHCEKDNDIFAHAEILALKEGLKAEPSKHLKGYSLIVTLEPCLMCLGAILSASVSNVWYLVKSTDCGGFTKYDPFISKEIESHYLPNEDAEKLLKDFFLNLRSKKE